jgi:predicted ATPase
MLKRITLENFFSFGEPTTIDLNPGVNLLVGINGSGKSNFLKAIRLLHEAIAGKGLENLLLKEWGGLDEITNLSGGRSSVIKLTYEFGYTLDEFEDTLHTYKLVIRTFSNLEYIFDEYLTTIESKKKEEVKLIDVTGGNQSRKHITGRVRNSRNSLTLLESTNNNLDPRELILGQVKENNWGIHYLFKFINSINSYNYFDLSNGSKIRQANNFGVEEYLLPSGENLNTIIQKVKNNHSLEYENIERLLKDINPHFKDISFNLFGSKSYLLLREKNLSKAISIEHISDGTLYYLLLLSIFYNPSRGMGICIDEPETGLHPDMINTIADSIKYASKGTQFFIATHSPLLLNAFNLDDILIFEKDEKNQTKVEYKSEDDFEDWDENSLVGQLWLNGQLGGKRW